MLCSARAAHRTATTRTRQVLLPYNDCNSLFEPCTVRRAQHILSQKHRNSLLECIRLLSFMPPRLQFGIGRLFRIVPFRFLFVLFLVLMCIVNFSWMTALYSRGQKGPYPISRIQSAALVFFPTAGAADNNFCACYSRSSSLNDITSFSAGSSPSSPYEHTQS